VEDCLDAFHHQELFDRDGNVDLMSRPKTETSPGTTIPAHFGLKIAKDLARAFLM
jgi:hypothetical protein